MTATTSPPKVETARLADQLERSFRGGAWHGPSIAEVLEGVDPAAARRRPLAGGHTIAEIVGHVAFWIEAASRRLEGDPVSGAGEDDWPAAPEDDDGWHRLLAALDAAHRRLHAKVAAMDDAALDGVVAGCDPTVRGLLLGILQHNAYHGGQIALLRKAGAAEGR